MRTRLASTVSASVEYVRSLQDRLIADYVEPYSVTAAYWGLSFVFLYLGLQKVVPPRSTADIQLATIAGLVGQPYIPFVMFVGVWQMVIGALFLLRRLRLCAWFFFAYQFFTMSTLVVLRRIVFQPPWIDVFGVDVPWALGSYAAFILKNVVIIGTFFVLVSLELEPSDPAAGDDSLEKGEPADEASTRPGLLAIPVVGVSGLARPGARVENALRGTLSRRGSRVGRLVSTVYGRATRVIDRIHAGQDYLVSNYFRPHCVTFLYLALAFVFFYFGFQKPSPAYSPVRTPMADFLPRIGLSLSTGMLLIGTYEMFLGLLLLFREIRTAFWLFFPHQAVTFLSLLVIPFVAFQPPWLSVLGVEIPWALTGYGAFVVKNVVFVAGFSLLVSIELGDETLDAEPTTDVAQTGDLREQVERA